MRTVQKSPWAAFKALHGQNQDFYIGILRSMAASVDTEFASHVRRISDPLDILRLEVDPDDYENPDAFRHDYLLSQLLSKFSDFDIDVDREKVAYEKFFDAEAQCKSINNSLSKFKKSKTWTCEPLLWVARKKIESLIGFEPDIDDLVCQADFSGGASFSLKRRESSPSCKFSLENPDVTLNCLPLARYFVSKSEHWQGNIKNFNIVRGNRVTTVPKNSKTDRVIAIEPTLNMYIQKGIGSHFRDRLASRGISLTDQSVNQRFALRGSLHNDIATIDLAAASDTISLEICRMLLPPKWYELLLMCRSDEGLIGDTWHEYAKISSMGNGYTFELESMIFWALSSACAESSGFGLQDVSVYGDDIIVPKDVAPLLIELLEYCGFKTNDDKTFVSGPFRESCGKHYFRGVDVSPFYVRSQFTNLTCLFLFLNNHRRWCSVSGLYDPRYYSTYSKCLQHVPEQWRKPRIPDGVGDGALIGSFDEVLPSFNKNGNYRVKVFCPDIRMKQNPQLGGLLYWHNKKKISDRIEKLSKTQSRKSLMGTPERVVLTSSMSVDKGRDVVKTISLLEWSDIPGISL